MNVWTIFVCRIRSNYEQETQKASIWTASFFPSKVNYDRNSLLLMNLGKTNRNTAEWTLVFAGFSAIVKSLFWNHIWNGGKLTLSSVLKTRTKYWKLYWNIGCDNNIFPICHKIIKWVIPCFFRWVIRDGKPEVRTISEMRKLEFPVGMPIMVRAIPFGKRQKIWAAIWGESNFPLFECLQLILIQFVATDRSPTLSNFIVLCFYTRLQPGWFV